MAPQTSGAAAANLGSREDVERLLGEASKNHSETKQLEIVRMMQKRKKAIITLETPGKDANLKLVLLEPGAIRTATFQARALYRAGPQRDRYGRMAIIMDRLILKNCAIGNDGRPVFPEKLTDADLEALLEQQSPENRRRILTTCRRMAKTAAQKLEIAKKHGLRYSPGKPDGSPENPEKPADFVFYDSKSGEHIRLPEEIREMTRS